MNTLKRGFFKFIFNLILITFHLIVIGQTYDCSVGQGNEIVNWREQVLDSHFLGSCPTGSTLSYCPTFFTLSYGGSYTLNYIDQGGSGMDAYSNIIIGSAKLSGNWIPGNITLTGMPVTIGNISDEMSLEWKVSQENAFDFDDKWMASINFIFDSNGTQNSEPVDSERDYDLVIKSVSHNFNGDDLIDNPITNGNNVFWYYARESNGNIKPYIVNIDGVSYTYAVRYKFFQNSGNQDNKVHLKFIPYGPNGAPPTTKINIKEIIAVTKNYIPFANLPLAQLNLANSKVAIESTWLKSINAGYELYTGQSVLKIEKFKVYPQGNLSIFENEFSDLKISVYPNPANDYLSFKGLKVENPKVEIFDFTGKLIKSEILNSDINKLNVQNLTSGLYLIRILSNDKIMGTVRFVINK